MNILKRRFRGQIAIITVLALPAMLGALALTCDMAVMYVTWSNLQRAADAATLAGANELPAQPANAVAEAKLYANANGIASSEIVSTTVSGTNQSLTMIVQRTVPHLFGRVVGLFNAPIQVQSIAALKPAGSVNGLIPIGVYCLGKAKPCDLATVKSGPGNWGFVQLDGPGGNLIGTDLATGSTTWHSVGDVLTMKPGCDNGAAKQMQTRLDDATAFEAIHPNPDGQPPSATDFVSGDPRAVEAPIVSTDPTTLKGATVNTTILGFVGFWVSGVSCNSITGVVISDVTATARPSNAPGLCTTGPCIPVLVPVAI
jgi:hypothetical protein